MATQRILFGDWMPDLPDTQGQPTSNLDMAFNVYSSSTGYAPFPTTSRVSDDMPNGEKILGLYSAQYKAENIIYAGTDAQIYANTNILRTGSSTGVGKIGGYSSPQVNWQFTEFGTVVLANNGQDKIQYLNLADAGQTNFEDIAEAPVCTTMAIVRDFVFAGNCDEETNKVQWSDLNNEQKWVSSDINQADFQILPAGGTVKAVIGGEFGLILQEKAVQRASYIGTPLIFQFDLISDNTGCLAGSSAIGHNGIAYWISESGFMACDGSTVTPIGEGKIDNWFVDRLDKTQLKDISVAVEPIKNLIIWNFPTASAKRGFMMFNFVTGKWTTGETESSVIASLATQGRTLDSLDVDYPELDTMPLSLDSPLFIGGQYAFCGAVDSHVVAFDLIPTDCLLTTNDVELGAFSVATLARPIIENGSADFQIASRQSLNDNIEFSPVSVTSQENRADLRSGGRYHRVRTKPTGAWTNAVGFDIDITVQGSR